jgi:hypothetical protein
MKLALQKSQNAELRSQFEGLLYFNATAPFLFNAGCGFYVFRYMHL